MAGAERRERDGAGEIVGLLLGRREQIGLAPALGRGRDERARAGGDRDRARLEPQRRAEAREAGVDRVIGVAGRDREQARPIAQRLTTDRSRWPRAGRARRPRAGSRARWRRGTRRPRGWTPRRAARRRRRGSAAARARRRAAAGGRGRRRSQLGRRAHLAGERHLLERHALPAQPVGDQRPVEARRVARSRLPRLAARSGRQGVEAGWPGASSGSSPCSMVAHMVSGVGEDGAASAPASACSIASCAITVLPRQGRGRAWPIWSRIDHAGGARRDPRRPRRWPGAPPARGRPRARAPAGRREPRRDRRRARSTGPAPPRPCGARPARHFFVDLIDRAQRGPHDRERAAGDAGEHLAEVAWIERLRPAALTSSRIG